MALHATLVNKHTVEFLTQVNGGLRPRIQKQKTILVYADRIDDEFYNEILTMPEFEAKYEFHDPSDCIDSNCNIVTLK